MQLIKLFYPYIPRNLGLNCPGIVPRANLYGKFPILAVWKPYANTVTTITLKFDIRVLSLYVYN